MTGAHGHRLLDHALGGDSTATAVDDGDTSLSYADLLQRSEDLAARLRQRGAALVALQARNGCAWVVVDLACQLAGIPLLPLPAFFSRDQLRHALRQTAADVVLTDHPRQIEALGAGFTAQPWHSGTGLAWLGRQPPAAGALPAGTGKITYTSGSTGAPKGVCLATGQLVRQALALRERVALASPRHLCLLPLAVLLENVAGVYTCLSAGGQVLAPDLATLGLAGSSSVDAGTLTRAIDRLRPNTLILIPQLLVGLVAACEQRWRPPSSLAFIAVGGSRVSASLILQARSWGLPVYEGYGLSECASVVSLNTPGQDRPGSAGRPLDHFEVAVDHGEITVAGNPFLGYMDEPQSWHPPAVSTGDLGELDSDGFLYLRGRRKNLLISSFGRNISPEWIESELMASPLVRDCVVFGDGRPWLTALICPGDGVDDAGIDAWLRQCNRRLPDYARVQGWQRLPEPLAAVPGLLTATGKPRRGEVERHFAAALECLYAQLSEVVP